MSSSWPITTSNRPPLNGYYQALRRRIEHDKIGVGRIKLRKLTAVRRIASTGT